jgi:hypothetical protein
MSIQVLVAKFTQSHKSRIRRTYRFNDLTVVLDKSDYIKTSRHLKKILLDPHQGFFDTASQCFGVESIAGTQRVTVSPTLVHKHDPEKV